MKKRTIGFLTFLTAAGVSIFALAQGALTPESTHSVTNIPGKIASDTAQPCGYVWAYHSLPEISAEFQAAAQAVNPEAEARAEAFGEDCVTADGSSTFSALETDFYILIPVSDLADEQALGTFIETILPIVDGFARPRLPGPQDGFVEFTFRNGDQQRVVRVPILLGRQLREQELHGGDLMRAIENQ